MLGRPIRVLVADDHMIVRTGIRHVLEGQAEFEVVGEAASGEEALELTPRLRPDVVLLDISMPGPSGLQVTERLRTISPGTRVLILSMYDNAEYVLQSVRAGAHGYLLKDTAATELRDAVRTVCRGESYFSPPVATRLTAAVRGEESHPGLEQLTGREREVLLGIARGQTNKEIAGELGISHRTVETHRESLMRKLKLRSVAELTRFAL
ncbi:MAG TPA: response regulator transcription factor, partial [Gemmatimonadales bacterium]|nr:response regulator transcription factor [Gemmatimonadales bacterium]